MFYILQMVRDFPLRKAPWDKNSRNNKVKKIIYCYTVYFYIYIYCCTEYLIIRLSFFLLKKISYSDCIFSESENGQRRYEFHFRFPPEFDSKKFNDHFPTLACLAVAVAAGYLLTRPREETRHVSWQEFRVKYLEKGQVQKLEVINGTLVKGYLHTDNDYIGVSYHKHTSAYSIVY